MKSKNVLAILSIYVYAWITLKVGKSRKKMDIVFVPIFKIILREPINSNLLALSVCKSLTLPRVLQSPLGFITRDVITIVALLYTL